ncbi:hypothetical protein Tco_0715781 [Tanacetum coccineum]
MEGTQLPKHNAHLSSMVLCVYPSTSLNMISAATTESIHIPIANVLSCFEDVFVVPTALSPMRDFDHKIILKKELIKSGVIRPSQSLFSSPIVMVKKKEGTWRICIDYRGLIAQTIKDKFSIPIIKELIDELQDHIIFQN